MRILYLSDRYAWNVYGVKRSLFEEMQSRGHDMVWQDVAQSTRPKGEFDQVWAAHSGLKPLRCAPIVLGFGFSDPNNFTTDRFVHYDAYVTNNATIHESNHNRLPSHYMPSWCDLKFHEQRDEVGKDIGASLIGCASHPWMCPTSKRIDWVKVLKSRGLDVQCWGSGWSNGSCVGDAFLNVINRSHIGLDISEKDSPLAHRLFEYAACGTPVIARRRDEVTMHFREGEEILLYDGLEDLVDQLRTALEVPYRLARIGTNARRRCVGEHTIAHRVDDLLQFVEGLAPAQ